MDIKQKIKLFREFIANSKIIIVDSQRPTANKLERDLVKIGAPKENILKVMNFNNALDAIAKEKPAMVLSEYLLQGGSGFDVFHHLRENHPELTKSLFVMITGNADQVVVAKAAEEDVDAFIMKPYQTEDLKDQLMKCFSIHLYPSEYRQKILQGKSLMASKNFNEAISAFREAMDFADEPTLAIFYIGQTLKLQKRFDEADSTFEKGLEINKYHYKLRTGLYESLIEQGRSEEAYEVIKVLVDIFPANFQRFKKAIREAVATVNFKDITSFYETYKKLEGTGPMENKALSAGLYISAKYELLFEKNLVNSLELIEKLFEVCESKNRFLLAVVEVLWGNGHHEEAKHFYNLFAQPNDSDKDFLMTRFIIEAIENPPDLLNRAYEYHRKGVENLTLNKFIIRGLIEKGEFAEAKKFYLESRREWPERKYELRDFRLQIYRAA